METPAPPAPIPLIWKAFLRFWIAPGKTVRDLAEVRAGGIFAILSACLLGVSLAAPIMYEQSGSDPVFINFSRFRDVLIAGIAGGIAGIFLFSWLYRNFSRMLGGTGTLASVRIGLGWGCLPLALLSSALTLIYIGIAPQAFESIDDQLVLRSNYANIVGPLSIFAFVGFIYGYTCLLLSLSAAVELRILKAFFAFLITIAVSFFPITFLLQWVTGRV